MQRLLSFSVLLQLNPGAQLTAGQVRAIANLVATSVEGLTPENVTIVDSRGTVLNSPSMMELGGNVSDRFEMQWLYEQQLENSVVAMLERIYGFGNVVARINAVLDFAHLEQYNETFSPINRGEGLVRSSQSAEESYSGTSAGAGGVPGVDSNVPGYVFLEEEGGTTEWQRSEDITNYELNRTETWTTTPPGQVTNLAVSVWINGDLTPTQLASIEESVIRATGLRTDRGDSVYVASVPFEVSPFVGDLPTLEVSTGVPLYWIIALGILLLLALLFVVFRKKSPVPEEVPVAASLDIVVDDELPERALTPEERERQTMRKQIEKLAEEKPEDVASLMRTWLVDD